LCGYGSRTREEILGEFRDGVHDRINRHAPGFGAGRKWDSEWQRAADPEGEDARAFEEAWWAKYRTDRVAPSELANLANEIRVFQSVLAKGGTERAVITAFSMRVLGRFLNTPIGESVVRVAPGRHGKMYYLERGVMFP
jgi:hypothetical protein